MSGKLSFAIPTLVLLVLLLGAGSSEAVTIAPPTLPPDQSAEGGEEDEEWEEEEEEWEEIEEEAETSLHPPDECLLRTASAHAVARHQRLKLTVGYTTYEPVNATIEIRQGATRVGTFKRHLGKSGVLRFTSDLGKRRPKGIAIRIRPSRGAAGCPSRRLVLFPR